VRERRDVAGARRRGGDRQHPALVADHLSDHPQLLRRARRLFDSSEIDQMLVLNILALTDEEKRECASPIRAREILERTESLTPDQLMRLHGTIRELSVVREGP
jgi:hypothetical protein